MNWIELAQDEAQQLGVALPEEAANWILWEHTGFPSFFQGDPERECRRQIREKLMERLDWWREKHPFTASGPTVFERLLGDEGV